MYEFSLSESLYEQAAKAARSDKVSVEEFVIRAVRERVGDSEDAAVQQMFTPEKLELISLAEAEIEAGEFLTVEQVRDHFARRESSWVGNAGH